MSKHNIKTIITLIGFLLIGIAGGWTVTYTLTPPKTETKIETEIVDTNAEVVEAEEQVPALIDETILEVVKSYVDVEDIKTVESVDAKPSCPEGEECGQGAYVYAPTDSLANFYNYVIGKCWDVDHFAGSQCWDLGALFWMNYTKDGRTLSTCGTGAAKGEWDCREQNAGDEFELITDRTKVKRGAHVVLKNGQWGHHFIALGDYNNGYVAALGTNQGGLACAGGGSAANVINIHLTDENFAGAFMPKTYIEPEPTPEPEPEVSGEIVYTYVPGDYFSGVIVRLGLATEHGLWGPDGDVAFYNQQLLAQGLVMDDHGRIYGNIPVGSEIRLERRQ